MFIGLFHCDGPMLQQRPSAVDRLTLDGREKVSSRFVDRTAEHRDECRPGSALRPCRNYGRPRISGSSVGVKPHFAIFLNECSRHTGGDRGRRSAGRSPRDGGNAPHSRYFEFGTNRPSRYYRGDGRPSPHPPDDPSASVSPARLCGALFLRLKVGSLLGFIAHHHDHQGLAPGAVVPVCRLFGPQFTADAGKIVVLPVRPGVFV